MGINFADGAVCFAEGKQWFLQVGMEDMLFDWYMCSRPFDSVITIEDYQLNTIKEGDCIEVSELDEQKYNGVIKTVGLFGFKECISFKSLKLCELLLIDSDGDAVGCNKAHIEVKRKLTYSQIMSIGELKRLEIERDKSDDTADKGISTDEELRVAREYFSKTGTIDGNLLRKHTLVWPDDFLPKDSKIVLDGVEVAVKWDCNKMLNTSETPNSSDEWPQIGDEVSLRYKFDSKQVMHTGKLLYLSDNHIIITTDKNNDYHCHRCDWDIEKPKTSEEKLRDELVTLRNKTEESFIDALLDNFKLIKKGAKV